MQHDLCSHIRFDMKDRQTTALQLHALPFARSGQQGILAPLLALPVHAFAVFVCYFNSGSSYI